MLVPLLLLWLLFLDYVSAFVPSAHSAIRGRTLSFPAAKPQFPNLNAKGRKKNRDHAPFSITSVPFLSDDTNAVKSSLETLLMLSDKKRQEVWKDDMKKQYPFVPSVFVDMFADSVISAFAAIAPSELQMVAQPSGLEKVRSKMGSSIKNELKKSDMYANLPLTDGDKDKMLSSLIGASLDLLLQDAAMVLAHPNEKLQALEAEKRQITRFMTKRQLLWYQVRYHTVRSALAIAVGTLLLALLYNGYKSTSVVQAIEKSIIKLYVLVKSLFGGLSRLVSGSKSGRRTRIRRRVR